jgi:hypothetical protein
MALSLSSLHSTDSDDPPVTLIYGVDGVGKSTLAAEFPDAIYIPTQGERMPAGVNLPMPGIVESYGDMLDIIGDLITTKHEFKTVIIDSLDGFEPLVHAVTCARIGASSIDANDKGSPAAFGRGYLEADVEWSDFMGGVAALSKSGVAVVLLAHPDIVRFDSPITDPYARYQIKLNKRAAAVVRERSDIVAFMNYRVLIKEKEVAQKKSIAHGVGGAERIIHLEERAGFVAKNRFNMPPDITFKKGSGYTELSKYFPAPTGVANDNDAAEEAAAA